MGYQPNAVKYTVLLTPDIWQSLDIIAANEGYTSTRKYINALTREIGIAHSHQGQCEGKRKKRMNTYQVPRHLEKAFANLSCRLGLPTSTIITVVLLIKVMQQMELPAYQEGSSC